MHAMATRARQPLPVQPGALPAPAPPAYRPLLRPKPKKRSRLLGALRWLYCLLLVRPVGRRARAARLAELPERTLRDTGLQRAHVLAAACGIVRLRDVVRAYPSAGPLCVCGRPGFRPTLVRLGEAA